VSDEIKIKIISKRSNKRQNGIINIQVKPSKTNICKHSEKNKIQVRNPNPHLK